MKFYEIDVSGVTAFTDSIKQDQMFAFEFLRPKPSNHQLIRIGGSIDGAYLIPDDLQGIEACFSPGVANFKNFEDQLLEEYDISSHMADKSSDVSKFKTPLVAGKQTFQKKWLDVALSEDSVPLSTWVGECAPGNSDLILQIDIEGAEYRNLLAAPVEVLNRFRIIVMELHNLGSLNHPGIVSKVLGPFFRKLANNFVCLHAHPNNCCGEKLIDNVGMRIPNVMEVTLIRKDRNSKRSKKGQYPARIPHPMDIARNVRTQPPLHFDEKWIRPDDSPEGRIKRLEDELDFYKSPDSLSSWSLDHQKQVSRFFSKLIPLVENHADSQVQSSDPAISKSPRELATGKRFLLSSSYGSYPTEGVVKPHEPFFFHTGFGLEQSIMLDLEEEHKIDHIKIRNRTDGLNYRAAPLFCLLHKQKDPWTGVAKVFNFDEDFLSGKQMQQILVVGGQAARFVTIICPLWTALHLSDIQVSGT